MKNLSFKYKLVLLMLLPVLVSGFLLVQQVLHSVGVSKRSAQVEVYTELATVNSALVHELQKERGTTAGFWVLVVSSLVISWPSSEQRRMKSVPSGSVLYRSTVWKRRLCSNWSSMCKPS